VAQLSHSQYDQLERAIIDGSRISLYRRGTEYVVIPVKLKTVDGKEAVLATHPTTGERMTFVLGEIDRFEVVGK
jgi:hypothetical protein